MTINIRDQSFTISPGAGTFKRKIYCNDESLSANNIFGVVPVPTTRIFYVHNPISIFSKPPPPPSGLNEPGPRRIVNDRSLIVTLTACVVIDPAINAGP